MLTLAFFQKAYMATHWSYNSVLIHNDNNSWMVTVFNHFFQQKQHKTCSRSRFVFPPSQLHFRTAPNLPSFLKFSLQPFMTSPPLAITLNSYIYLHSIFCGCFQRACLPGSLLLPQLFLLRTSCAPKSQYFALSRQNQPVTSIRFSYTSTISLTEPFTPSFLLTALFLPPTPRDGLEPGPPITVCQGACPNGAWCQSTQELPRLKPRETLHLPFPPSSSSLSLILPAV